MLQDLTVTDDTVLEEHNEDPCIVQMRLIGDGGRLFCLPNYVRYCGYATMGSHKLSLQVITL
jgi:hypothetical protein